VFMAQRHVPRRDLLPAPTSSRSGHEGDDGSGAGGSSSGKAAKRTKVTAVACTPCQKRKSKCDGRRPICSSCEQKGRNDCVYDSQSDLRRTSALKQRIEVLQGEVDDLREILMGLCEAHASGQAGAALSMVHNNFGEGDFASANHLAQVFRTSTNLNRFRLQNQAPYGTASFRSAPDAFEAPPPMLMPPGPGQRYPPLVADGANISSVTEGRSEWSPLSNQDAEGEPDNQNYRGNYPYGA